MRNVVTNWIWYAIVVVHGFVVPRLINDYRGQELLGIWDWGWSLVLYVGLLSLGITSAVSRYTARYRAVEAWEDLNRAFSSSLAILASMCLLVILAVTAFDVTAAFLDRDVTSDQRATAQWTAILLISAAAIQLPGGAFNGIITGHERFDALNGIRWLRDSSSLVGMILILTLGGSIVGLAAFNLALEVAATLARAALAFRLCRTLRIGPQYVRRSVMAEMLQFGGKTVMQEFARGGLQYGVRLMLAKWLGPGTLAVFARQQALVMHAHRFLKQYSQVFVPSAAALHSEKNTKALQELMLKGNRWGMYFAVPLMIVLILQGGPLVQLWMKDPAFRAAEVIAVLAAGHVLAIGQNSAYSVLMGMGIHGFAAVLECIVAIIGLVVVGIGIGWLGWGMLSAAVVIGLCVTATGGVLIPLYACRALELPFGRYLLTILWGPLVACLPFVAVLLSVPPLLGTVGLWTQLGVTLGGSGAVLVITYWFFVFPPTVRDRILKRLGRRRDGAPEVAS